MSAPPLPAVVARARALFSGRALTLTDVWLPQDPIEGWTLGPPDSKPLDGPEGTTISVPAPQTWQEGFRAFRDAPGRPFFVLQSAADVLDDHVSGAGLLGGESEQYRDFSTRMGTFRTRLVQMRSILSQDQSKISDRVLNGFFVELMGVFGSVERLIFHHNGVRLDREFAGSLVKKALGRLRPEQRASASAVLAAANLAAEADRAIGPESIGAFIGSLGKEKSGATDEPEE